MADQLHSSFIPKAPLSVAPRRHPISLVTLLAVLVFLLAAAGWGGAFMYKKLLADSVAALEVELEAERPSYESPLLEEFERVERKLIAAEELINKHTTLTPLFVLLEQSTIPRVQYTSLSYSRTGKDLGSHQIVMIGEAKGYKSIAIQADIFKEARFKKIILTPVFSDFRVTKDGSISFTLTFTVPDDFVAYTTALGASEEDTVTREETTP